MRYIFPVFMIILIIRSMGVEMYKIYIKRFLDICISLCALLLLSPLLLVVCILVKVNIGSPIFFIQKRIGKNCKPFNMLKFRSMSGYRDKNGMLLPDEKRLTSFGIVLRKTSIDELPALVNILKGDMSLIGPRPLPIVYYPYFTEEELHRHDVRGGLTGLAQINGRNLLSWEDKFKYDLEYVENISFLLDLKIFFITFFKVFKQSDVIIRRADGKNDLDAQRKPLRGNIKE